MQGHQYVHQNPQTIQNELNQIRRERGDRAEHSTDVRGPQGVIINRPAANVTSTNMSN